MDLASLILSLPSYAENCIKTYKVIQAYRELDESFRKLMNRAISDSERLKHTMTNLNNTSAYSSASQLHFQHLLQESKSSMEKINVILDGWKKRLQITDDGPRPRTKRLKLLSIAFLFEKLIDPSKMFLLSFGANLERLVIREKKEVAKTSSGNGKAVDKNSSHLSNRFAELQYLVEGKSQIIEALEELERLLQQLDSALIASNSLSAESNDGFTCSDTIEFIRHAKERVATNMNVKHIDFESSLDPLTDIDLEMSTGIYRVTTGRFEGCIVDPRNVRYYSAKNKEDVAWHETENIARLFAEESKYSHLSSSVGILPSCGVTEMELHLHGVVFRLPPELGQTRTLRSILVEGNVKHSLRDRVQFAIRLAMSVLVVHSLGLVHKNIKPDSVLVAESPVDKAENLYPNKLGIPFLLAFDSSRTSSGPSMQGSFAVPDGGLWEILYTHPRHLIGYERQYDYEMRDDIFGLGICLLEVALWKSLFRWLPKPAGGYSFQVNTDVVDISIVGCRNALIAMGKPTSTSHILLRQRLLKEAAERMIPPIMGDIFKEVVVECLTFGDPKETNETCTSKQPNPDEQSIEFVQSTLSKLYSIKL
ncbi:hypothetical protein ACEPAH_4177 [Sanghuangporus vaninii]